ncbi:hypothetical protein FQN51_002896 [Onygenales sp. PD_10]|nr:hypothetical protein FQN51_002896 [Onygenales sp. PD_10]
MHKVLRAIDVDVPQQWVNDAVLSILTSITCYNRSVIHIAPEMSSEIKMGKMMWIISFLRLILSFQLFNTSEFSQLITKKLTV